MKKRFIAKKKKQRASKKIKVLILLTLFLAAFYSSLCFCARLKFKSDHQELLNILLSHSNSFIKEKKDNTFLVKAISYLLQIDVKRPSTLLYTGYTGIFKEQDKLTHIISKNVEEKQSILYKEPRVYIYNTHQKEEYQPSSFLEYSVSPNVMLSSYILKEQLDKSGIATIVEERDIQGEVSRLGKKYYYSYTVSRKFMEEAKLKYPTLEYFIDVHRDSVSKNLSYLEKDGKGYAKVLFIIGKENPNYQANYNFTKQIFDIMESKVPGITRSIYEKAGEGVDGVYNQDFSPNTILVEIGGEENTVDEVYNTTLVLGEALKEVIG